MKKILTAVALLLMLAALISARAQPIENAMIEREEYAIYSAIIPETYHNEEGGILVIENPSWRYPNQILKKDFYFFYPAPVVSQDTLDDFLQRNKTNRWFERKFQLEFAYVLVDRTEIDRLVGRNPVSEWKEFSKHYPASHGFASYSRVGFNQKMDQALVFRFWRCPYLCGESEFLLLERKEGTWKAVNRANRAVS
jgi:hypothetical protein